MYSTRLQTQSRYWHSGYRSPASGAIARLGSEVTRSAAARFCGRAPRARSSDWATGDVATSRSGQLAFELAPHRIRVNVVAAGWIRLPAFEQAWQAVSAREQAFVLEGISLRRLGKPDEVAAAIEFPAREASRCVTGATIDVNGGWWVS
ncbi:MAG: SDR family oxidoreductase [Geminicoccaceae bacterium]